MPHTNRTPGPAWFLIAAATAGMFAATASGSIRSPFLLDMAADLDTSLSAVANLFGVTAVCWGMSSYVSGLGADRFGRRIFLVLAPLCLAMAMGGVSVVSSYTALLLLVVLAGCSCGALTTASYAEVSLRVEDGQRGRALGWVMAGQSMTLLVAVPAAAWLGAAIGWRGVHLVIAALAIAGMAALFFATRETIADSDTRAKAEDRMTLREALSGPVIRLFVALIIERICFGLAVFYYPAFLRTTYEVPIESVALPLFVFALGNIAGTLLGGQLADRFPYRRVSFGVTMVAAGVFAVPWFAWHPGIGWTIALGFGFSIFDALARPSLMAAFAAVPPEVRASIMGLNSTMASAGWLVAAMVGGWLFTSGGFVTFGPLIGVACVVAALIVFPDSRIRHQSG